MPDGLSERARPAINADPDELVAAESGNLGGLSLSLAAPFEAALEEQARAEAAEAPVRTALLRVTLSDDTRKERRNLLAASVVGLAVGWAGVVPEQASILGVQIGVDDSDRLLMLMVGVVGYFLVSFTLYALSDMAVGRVTGYMALATRRTAASSEPSTHERAEDAVIRLARVVVRGRASRQLQRKLDWWASSTSVAAGAVWVIDYLFPLAVAVWALWELIGTL